jgi:hypothetical protein
MNSSVHTIRTVEFEIVNVGTITALLSMVKALKHRGSRDACIRPVTDITPGTSLEGGPK